MHMQSHSENPFNDSNGSIGLALDDDEENVSYHFPGE